MTGEQNLHDVVVPHAFSAAPERVFDAWLDPRLIQQWFGPGLGETQPVAVDPRVGGAFRIVQVRDGEPVGHTGKYLTLERPRELAFTWAVDGVEDYSEVRVRIEPAADGSSVRLVHRVDAEWKDYGDRIHHAWLSMMKEMDAILSR
jgi:uncharacterized protein YndB with AHSA1/START domain